MSRRGGLGASLAVWGCPPTPVSTQGDGPVPTYPPGVLAPARMLPSTGWSNATTRGPALPPGLSAPVVPPPGLTTSWREEIAINAGRANHPHPPGLMPPKWPKAPLLPSATAARGGYVYQEEGQFVVTDAMPVYVKLRSSQDAQGAPHSGLDESEGSTADSDHFVTTQSAGATDIGGGEVMNPGSIGHPELCPRPCLYFDSGRCVNGSSCRFCHVTHVKRPAHLDKRHRALFRDLPASVTLPLVLRLLKDKAAKVNLSMPVQAELNHLSDLAAAIKMWEQPTGDAKAPQTQHKTKDLNSLRTALQAMTFRSLLSTLRHASLPADTPVFASVQSLMQLLNPEEDKPTSVDEMQ